MHLISPTKFWSFRQFKMWGNRSWKIFWGFYMWLENSATKKREESKISNPSAGGREKKV